jgi:hypothetical protein
MGSKSRGGCRFLVRTRAPHHTWKIVARMRYGCACSGVWCRRVVPEFTVSSSLFAANNAACACSGGWRHQWCSSSNARVHGW